METFKQYQSLLVRYLRPLWREVTLLAVLLFSGIGMQLWMPQILRRFIDMAQTGGVSGDLVRLAALFFVLVFVEKIVRVGTTYFAQDVRWQTTNRMRGDWRRTV